MNYKFSNLLGAPYRGGNVLLSGNELLSPVGNRISVVDLAESTSRTLPFENGHQIRVLCLSPCGGLLLSIDEEGRCIVINKRRRALLHHVSFKGPVAAAKFSPDGRYVAVAVGRMLQVWKRPCLDKVVAPMELHRKFGGCYADITALDWTDDSFGIVVGSKDLTVRVHTVDNVQGYRPPILSGHLEALVSACFVSESMKMKSMLAMEGGEQGLYPEAPVSLITVGRDGYVFEWVYNKGKQVGSLPGAIAEKGKEEEGSSETAHSDRSVGSGGNRGHHDLPDGALQLVEGGQQSMDSPCSSPDIAPIGQGELPSVRKRKAHELVADNRDSDSEADNADHFSDMQVVVAGRSGVLKRRTVKDWQYAGGRWKNARRYSCERRPAKVTCADYHKELGLLVVAFSNGMFELIQMPGFEKLQTLSVSRERLTSVCFGPRGEWLAVGSSKLGQLLVWEWRSETYKLKQQGHCSDISTCCFSPDGNTVVTGSEDCKVKVFSVASGFCFVTFSGHTMPVTGVQFLPSGHALVSASLDGTVRAFDLVRYRNFRTFTSPNPVQFVCLAVDPKGEVVVAGSLDTFQIFVWSFKTGRLLDMLAGHEGPVVGVTFSPTAALLASASWDKTVRIWTVFEGKGDVEVLDHNHEVLALAFRPDGKQMACSTLDGQIAFWDPIQGESLGTIEGRRDIAGGRLSSDRRAAGNRSSGACFTTLVYSADGTVVVAGGHSKYVCMYDVEERVLLRRFQISRNRSLDGVLDILNSKHVTDAGPLQLIDDEDSDREDWDLLPPTMGADAAYGLPGTGAKQKKSNVQTRCVILSPTGRSWAAATTEGLLLYSLDDTMTFDPTGLTEDVTPAAVLHAIESGEYLRALLMALCLKDEDMIGSSLESTPPDKIWAIARDVPDMRTPALLVHVAGKLASSPHVEFLLTWAKAICASHGPSLLNPNASTLAALRSLQRSLIRVKEDLASMCESNLFTLEYLTTKRHKWQEPVGLEQCPVNGSDDDSDRSGESAEE